MAISIMFLNLHGCNDPKEYMQEKLKKFFIFSPGATRERIKEIVDSIYKESLIHSEKEKTLPVAKESEFPVLSEVQNRLIYTKKSEMINTLKIISPLLKDEVVVEERFTYFKDKYAGIAKHAPILIRKTNFACLAYVFENAEITDKGDFKYILEEQTKEEKVKPVIFDSVTSTVESVCESFVKGMAGELPFPLNVIGSALLDGLFPDNSKIDYDKLINDFSEIVRNANNEQTVNEQKGALDGVLEYMQCTYSVKKRKGESKDILLGYLDAQQLILQSAIAILGEQDFAKPGLAFYVPAVDLRTTIYQEMALIDNPSDPKKSDYAVILVNHLVVNQRLAQATANDLKTDITNKRDAHMATISGVLDYQFCDENVCKTLYYFRDGTEKYNSGYYESHGCHDNPQQRCQEARDKYYNDKKKVYDDKLDKVIWLDTSVYYWNKIIQNPIPLKQTEYAATDKALN